MRNKREYPANWYDEIRPAILKRDNYRCTKCKVKNRQWVAKKNNAEPVWIDKDEIIDYTQEGYKCYQIFLHVCHINNDKKDCTTDNLITLCVTHHALLDGNYKALIKKGYKVNNQLDLAIEAQKLSRPHSLASLGRSDNSPLTGL